MLTNPRKSNDVDVRMLKDNPSWNTRGAATRAALLFAVWLMVAGWKPADIPVGLFAAAAAAWVSLALLPVVQAARPRYRALLTLLLRIMRGSVVAGFEIARRVLKPRLDLRPGLVAFPVSLPKGNARNVFFAIESLQPGNLPAGVDGNALIIHSLDISQPIAADLARDEAQFALATRHE
jgi:multicomponent Na+:H+ antiporter subunit E